uniref:Uncharacterized protein n=1 Tax=Haptolina ericina TaxID=156174 RepID=A0A7S3EVD5_9EUKA
MADPADPADPDTPDGEVRPLVWVRAVAVAPASPSGMSRKISVSYDRQASRGTAIQAADIPQNQQAATRAYRGLELAAKKERLQQMCSGLASPSSLRPSSPSPSASAEVRTGSSHATAQAAAGLGLGFAASGPPVR